MSHTRQVTGTIHTPDGAPWAGFVIGFDVPKTATTTHATLPGTSLGASTTANTITVETDSTGAFSVELEVGVSIRVTMIGALIQSGSSVRYPQDAQFVIVVPEGATPIDLATIRADAITPPGDPTLVNALADHLADTANPHAVTAEQIGLGNVPNVDATSRANHTGTQAASTISDFDSAADARIAAQAGQPSGLATLDAAGLLPTAQLPPLAITTPHVVADEAAMLALDAQAGDMAIREDESRAYVHNGGTAGTVADWTLLAAPPDAVLSVNGKTGTVALVKADIGLGNVDNTSDAAKPISTATATALAGKVGLTGDQTIAGAKTFAASPLVPAPTAPDHAAPKGYVDGLIAGALGVVVHGSDAGAARPSAYAAIQWIGNVEPAAMIDGDMWISEP